MSNNCLNTDGAGKNMSKKGMINVNVRNARLETPLHLAAYNGIFKLFSIRCFRW